MKYQYIAFNFWHRTSQKDVYVFWTQLKLAFLFMYGRFLINSVTKLVVRQIIFSIFSEFEFKQIVRDKAQLGDKCILVHVRKLKKQKVIH